MVSSQVVERRLTWNNCRNVRDLGGLPTVDGFVTRWRALVRADSLSQLVEGGREQVIAYGVRTIIDVRLPVEAIEHPNPFAIPGTHRIDYTALSILDPSIPHVPQLAKLPDDYQQMLAHREDAIAAAMTAVARAVDGCVVLHCAGGTDRTGLLIAMLLDFVGVPRDVIAHDYALSTDQRNVYNAWLEHGPGEREERAQRFAQAMPRAEIMAETLQFLDDRYGGTESYLRGIGISAVDLANIRKRLTIQSPIETSRPSSAER